MFYIIICVCNYVIIIVYIYIILLFIDVCYFLQKYHLYLIGAILFDDHYWY